MPAKSRTSSTPESIDPSQLPRLGQLEARVMELIWDQGAWMTTREVLDALSTRRNRAYTTVMTILVHLWKKGLLERRKDGRAYAYHAVHSKAEWTAQRMGELLTLADSRSEALNHFVAEMSQEDVNQLRRVLRIQQ